MWRSNGSLVCGSPSDVGRVTRNLIVVGRAGSNTGRSPSVFTVQRSTPHSTRAVATDVPGVREAKPAISPPPATSATAAAIRGRVPIGRQYARRVGTPTDFAAHPTTHVKRCYVKSRQKRSPYAP